MKRSIIYTILFVITVIVFSLCSGGYFFSFYYTTEEGDEYYHSKASENILILNYSQNIKSIGYCFTNQNSCSDYLSYEGDLSKRILNVSIDYPDSDTGMRICVRIRSNKNTAVHCSDELYVVDSYEPVVNSLYNEVSIDSDIAKEEKVGKVIEVTDETFQKEVLESDKKILVEFYADWCGPCKKLSPILEEIAKENVDLKVVKVNVDDNTDLAAKYGTNYIPLLVVIEDGIEVNKGVGALSKEDILELVK